MYNSSFKVELETAKPSDSWDSEANEKEKKVEINWLKEFEMGQR